MTDHWLPSVKGLCPRCRNSTLFLDEGGHVTCSWVDCPDPGAANGLLTSVSHYGAPVTIERIKQAHSSINAEWLESTRAGAVPLYNQGHNETCYFCALVFGLEEAQAQVADLTDQLHEAKRGWRRIELCGPGADERWVLTYDAPTANFSRDLTDQLHQAERDRDEARKQVAQVNRWYEHAQAAEARAERAWVVLDWLAENMPRALELCPYKAHRGPVGNEPVTERDALVAQLQEADAKAECFRNKAEAERERADKAERALAEARPHIADAVNALDGCDGADGTSPAAEAARIIDAALAAASGESHE